ncbi:MAG: GNAT family N-acetyltransferase [Parachlamydia sp.]|jgi:ribosomal protein S18 acetylase RimI-like enzyme|nr:GNAT family N-acetyltransferase [Parachlamydia sp.]
MSFETTSILDVPPGSYKNFSCGNIELDQFLKRFAKGNHKKGMGKTFVLEENEFIVGFYTVSMGSLEFSSFPDDKQSGLPKYPVPIAKIGRLAVDEQFKGNGIGRLLLVDALHRIYHAAQIIAAFAIIVDAKNKSAKDFYRHFGFKECKNSELSLFLPIDSIKDFFI